MTERQLWLRVAKLLENGEQEFTCFAIDEVCDRPTVRVALYERMREAASRWAHRIKRVEYDPLGCVAAYDDFTPAVQRKRVAFCTRMAARAAARAALRKRAR
jgi:hypothetical protein